MRKKSITVCWVLALCGGVTVALASSGCVRTNSLIKPRLAAQGAHAPTDRAENKNELQILFAFEADLRRAGISKELTARVVERVNKTAPGHDLSLQELLTHIMTEALKEAANVRGDEKATQTRLNLVEVIIGSLFDNALRSAPASKNPVELLKVLATVGIATLRSADPGVDFKAATKAIFKSTVNSLKHRPAVNLLEALREVSEKALFQLLSTSPSEQIAIGETKAFFNGALDGLSRTDLSEDQLADAVEAVAHGTLDELSRRNFAIGNKRSLTDELVRATVLALSARGIPAAKSSNIMSGIAEIISSKVPDRPVGTGVSVSGIQDVPVLVRLERGAGSGYLAPEGDFAGSVVVSGVHNGTLGLWTCNAGSCSAFFTPIPGFFGQAGFQYKVTANKFEQANFASASLVFRQNTPPAMTCPPSSVAALPGTPVSRNCSAVDAEGDQFTFAISGCVGIGIDPNSGAISGSMPLDTCISVVSVKDVHGAKSVVSIPLKVPVKFDLVLGQPNFFTANTSTRVGLSGPGKMSTDGTRLLVAELYNNRVSIFSSLPSASMAIPDLFIGQANSAGITANNGGLSARSLSLPTCAHIHLGKLYVCDSGNSRILIWNSVPTTSGVPADIVLGQPDFTSDSCNNGGVSATSMCSPADVAFSGTKLLVSDAANNRVLIWNTIPTQSGAPADVVIGQTTLTANAAGTAADKLNPLYGGGLLVHAGKLYLADFYNHRVLVWNSIPTANGAPADVVIGQSVMTTANAGTTATTLRHPSAVATDGVKLFIADAHNWRILIFNNLPTANLPSADAVLSQPDLVTGVRRSSSSRDILTPGGLLTNAGKIYANDFYSGRILVWNTTSPANYAHADFAIGQRNTTDFGANTPLVNERQWGNVSGISQLGDGLLIADHSANRMLFFKSIPTSDFAAADLVVGQPHFQNAMPNRGATALATTLSGVNHASTGGGRLFAGDYANNRVLIWNAVPGGLNVPADVVLGQSDFVSSGANASGVSSTSLSGPTSAELIAGRLFVSDSANNRLLVWNTIPAANAAPADVVFGQADFTTNAINQGGVGPKTLSSPRKVVTDGARLFVPDVGNNRVLIWNSIPTSGSVPPDVVVGQPDFVSNLPNNGGVSARSLNGPISVALRDGKLVVADMYNNRVLVWNSIPTKNFVAADSVIGQLDFASIKENFSGINDFGLFGPHSVLFDTIGKLWIADLFNGRALRCSVP